MRTMPGRNGGTLKRPEKGESGNPYGRPKKLVSTLLAELNAAGYERVGPSSVAHVFETLIGVPQDQLSDMLQDKEQPMAVRIVVKAMLSAKGFEVLQTMLDRAHGKAKQQLDLTGAGQFHVPVINVVVQAPPGSDAK